MHREIALNRHTREAFERAHRERSEVFHRIVLRLVGRRRPTDGRR